MNLIGPIMTFMQNRQLCSFLLGMFFAASANAQDEISPALMASKSQEGYIKTTRGLELIKFNVVDEYAIVEGDIIIGKTEDFPNSGRKSLIVRNPAQLWPGRTVPYTINPAMRNQAHIAAAIAHWRARTGLNFIERSTSNAEQFPNYVYFTNTNNQVCSSYVGMQGGRQPIELADACGIGAAIHEIGHAVGLAHEHTRSDRDKYIKVYLENVELDMQFNFAVRSDIYADSGVYDFGSIMHYGRIAFSKNDQPTILPRSGEHIGQRVELSTGDIASLARLYPKQSEERVCVTFSILNQPHADGIGDIDVQLFVSGTKVVDAVIPYRSSYGHYPYEKFKFWASKGPHSFALSSARGIASLSGSLPVNNRTTALQVEYWGQENGRPLRFFTSALIPYYDDIDDDISCTANSPTVGLSASSLFAVAQPTALQVKDGRAPTDDWPQSNEPTYSADRLVIPADTTHKIPIGVTEYRIKELEIGDGATIWFPYDLNRFTFLAERSAIGRKVRFLANAGSGETGADGPHPGANGSDGGPGANAMTLYLSLGQARVGPKLRVYMQGGNGGTGGTGRQGKYGLDANCIPPIDAKNGGAGGAGGYAGQAGAGGYLFLRGVLKTPLDSFVAFVQGGESDTQGGLGGVGGPGGRGANCGIFKFGPGSTGAYGASRSGDAAGRMTGPDGKVYEEPTIALPR